MAHRPYVAVVGPGEATSEETRAAEAIGRGLAVGGAYGTLSEIALALRTSVPVIGWHTWDIEGVERVSSPGEAVARALKRAGGRGGS